MNVFGVLLGYLLPVIFIDSYTEGQKLDPEQRQHYKDQVFKMMLFVAIASSIITVLTFVSFREKPKARLCGGKAQNTQEIEGS